MSNRSATPVPAYTIRDAEEDDLPGILEILNEQIAGSTAIFRDDPFDIDDRRKWMRDARSAGFPIFVAVPVPFPVPSNSDDLTTSSRDSMEAEGFQNGVRRVGNDDWGDSIPDVLGFAYYGTFRPRAGYRFTAEHTLYIHKSVRGAGIGASLMQSLLSHAREHRRIHALIATITSDNVESIRFHERFGFEVVGRMKEVGYKFGEWLDVTFMELVLSGGGGRFEERRN